MKARKPLKGTWRPPSVTELWHKQIRMEETLKEVAKKANDQGNDIYALQHPTAPDTANRVLGNQAAEVLTRSESSMEIVRKRVCHINGHRIGRLDREVPNQELPDPTKAFHRTTVMKQEVICLACGMTLEEIRTAK